MKQETGFFRSKDNLRLRYRIWDINGGDAPAVLILHGNAEHSGRYGELAGFLNEKGCRVFAFDARGHGESEGERGYVRDFKDLTEDVDSFIDFVKERHKAENLYLFGHSMGGFIAAMYLLDGSKDVAGAILSSPVFKLGKSISFAISIFSGIIDAFFPKMKLYKPEKRYLTRNTAVIERYEKDPLVIHDKVFAHNAAQFVKALRGILPRLNQIRRPMLILHGDCDRLSDIRGSKNLFREAGSDDKDLKVYEGFYHELINEPGRETVYSDIAEWLHARKTEER
jgi:alpha-beta hydrolase superfamily lysophospholipase